MISEIFNKTRNFIYRNARPLDLTRWQYHFENGNREAVLTALSAYQNVDGGFGHALEPDSWNPNSSPIQTWAATEILKEIDYNLSDKDHPIVIGILNYLDSGIHMYLNTWVGCIPTNNDYPHAFWWGCEKFPSDEVGYNPTAALAGFGLLYSEIDSSIYKKCELIAVEAVNKYMNENYLNDMHEGLCYVRLMDSMEHCSMKQCSIEKVGIIDLFDFTSFKAKLIKQVKYCITQNTAEWETSYICKPSQFFNSVDSIFYEDNKALSEYECEYIIKTQLDDGSWNIPWGWNGYPEEWAISKNWWKANGAILNMLYLKGFRKL